MYPLSRSAASIAVSGPSTSTPSQTSDTRRHGTRSGADELAGHHVVAQRRPPLRLLLEQPGEHLFVARAITVLGVEPDLEPLRREQLHLVVLAPVARVPDLEVAARHP